MDLAKFNKVFGRPAFETAATKTPVEPTPGVPAATVKSELENQLGLAKEQNTAMQVEAGGPQLGTVQKPVDEAKPTLPFGFGNWVVESTSDYALGVRRRQPTDNIPQMSGVHVVDLSDLIVLFLQPKEQGHASDRQTESLPTENPKAAESTAEQATGPGSGSVNAEPRPI